MCKRINDVLWTDKCNGNMVVCMTGKEQAREGRMVYRRHSPWFEATNWSLGCLQLYTKRAHAFPNIV